MRTFLLLGLAAALFGQSAAFHEDKLHGRRAFVLENGRMRLSTLPGGGFIGEVRFQSDDPKKSVNPMRVPHYQTIDPFTYDVAKYGDLYGTGIQRRLMSGYMGHFLCFPQFAASSPAEFRQDYGQHGEAIAVEWKLEKVDTRKDGVTLRYSADLSEDEVPRGARHHTARRRDGGLRGGVGGEHGAVRPSDAVDPAYYLRPAVSGTGIRRLPMARWPRWWCGGDRRTRRRRIPGPRVKDSEGRTVDLRVFSGRSNTWLMDASKPKVWVTMYNVAYPVLIGYIFESKPNQWVFDWQENQHATEKPWDGKVIARAICIGDSVVGGLRNAVERGSEFGVPTYSWIEARERRTQKYAVFLAEIPPGFNGVAALRTENGQIVIEERGTGKMIAIKSGRMW